MWMCGGFFVLDGCVKDIIVLLNGMDFINWFFWNGLVCYVIYYGYMYIFV